MSRSRVLLLSLMAVFAFSTMVLAQGSGGALNGVVTDETGAALPGVTITATNDATGFSRVDVTNPAGAFRFASLPPGTYTVTADLSGFNAVTTRNVVVNVAVERNLGVSLRQAAVREQITVTADAPLIATTPSIGTTVSQQELENLPLNGRQFANLGSLAPGTSLAYNTDPTKPGQLTIALNGGIGRNVNYTVDGGDNMDDTIGGALQNYNLEAVQEFTIQTQQYKAEYGRSSGGVLSVVTKTGTNEFAGSAYGFFRDDSLNSKTEAEKRAGGEKSEYERKQYGASFGGPIIRDRAHFFGTYEKTTRPSSYIIDTGGVFPNFDGQAIGIPFEDELRTAKATVNLSAAQYLQVRYGYQLNTDKYGAGPLVLPSALGTLANEYKSYLAGHTWTIGGSMLNDFIYQYSRFANTITADSEDPNLQFPSGVLVGQNPNTPQGTFQEKSQFKNNFSWSSTLGGRRHDFKTGVNYIHEPILGGEFGTGVAGTFTLLNDSETSPVTRIAINGGAFAGFFTPIDQYSFYIQDDLYWSNRLTLNVGARYDKWTGFDLDQGSNGLITLLRNNTTYNDSPYYGDFRGWDGQLDDDDDNFSPRLGFTYDLAGDSKHILRGGLGRYYDFPYTNANVLFPAIAVQTSFGQIYENADPTGIKNADGSFFRPGQPLPPNQLIPGPAGTPNDVCAPSCTNVPYSDQISFGYSTQVTDWLGINADIVSIRYRDIPFRFRANGRLDANGNPMTDRRFAAGNFRIWSGEGEADYEGVNLGFRARVTDRVEMQGFYTLSRAEGNILAGADEFRLTNATYQPDVRAFADQSINFRDPNCDACFGPLNTDARHRVTMSALYRAPFAINVSGILRYRSATPFTDRAGADLDGDGFGNDLGAGVDEVNSLRGESFSQIDVRVSRDFRIVGNTGIEIIAEVFNLLNDDNPASFNGDRRLAAYKQPTRFSGDPLQGEQRLIQLGARFRF